MNLFWITLVFAVLYLVLYPGMGTWRGMLGWTQVGQYDKERSEAAAKVKPLYDKFAAMGIEQVAADPQGRAMGERIFLNNCAQCHGSDAGGSRGFPNLRDGDWLYGGDAKTIAETITGGRMGVMPPQAAALGEEGVKNVVAYVRMLSGLNADPLRAQQGKEKSASSARRATGPRARAIRRWARPNLTDSVWLYGSSEPRSRRR